jgi:hypothetical protein
MDLAVSIAKFRNTPAREEKVNSVTVLAPRIIIHDIACDWTLDEINCAWFKEPQFDNIDIPINNIK